MSATLDVLGAPAIDFDALALVLESSADIRLRSRELPEMLAAPAGLRVLVFHPSAEVWSPSDVLALRDAGHDALVVGDFDPGEISALESLGIPHVLRRHLSRMAQFGLGQTPLPAPGHDAPSRLTPREEAIGRLLARTPPPTRAEMATELGLSPSTVKVHIENLRRKVDAVGFSHTALVHRLKAYNIEA